MDWQWIGRLAMYRLIGKLIDRLAMDWWIGAGLTLDFQIGHGLVIGIGGLVMDWRIDNGLADWSRIDIRFPDWSWNDFGLADWQSNGRMVQDRHRIGNGLAMDWQVSYGLADW